MDTNQGRDRYEAIAGGFKVAAAVVVIGLILAASEGSINPDSTRTLHDAAVASAQPASPKFEYFPDGYTLNASEPAPQVEQF